MQYVCLLLTPLAYPVHSHGIASEEIKETAIELVFQDLKFSRVLGDAFQPVEYSQVPSLYFSTLRCGWARASAPRG
ncbi:hypothetical protein GQ43DRAFT_156596 [Delitschia confertaspora ATCC 74209]|uniref:Uncharacterized protein n=1 Tax=Delitschia confertaspora ATCC 74209 TaxID=1513339 RepID=A0A9P4JKQ3_9PLEO|nr:hypothetical protein GQ43DRAFT_156596 [Delitschia confertaspora ATCC 74209]